MKKRNWKQIHKAKLHNNRWLVWSAAIAIAAGVALVGYIKVTGIDFDRQMHDQTGSVNSTWSSFKSRTAGFTLKYPKTWGIEADNNSSISFVNSENPDDYFTVAWYPDTQEQEIRAALLSSKVDKVRVNGVDAVMVAQSKNQSENIIILKNNGKVFVLRGKGNSYSKIAGTFRLN